MSRTNVPLLIVVASYVLYFARVAGHDASDNISVIVTAGYILLLGMIFICFLNRDRAFIQGLESSVATLLLFVPGNYITGNDALKLTIFFLSIVLGGSFTLIFLYQYFKKSIQQ